MEAFIFLVIVGGALLGAYLYKKDERKGKSSSNGSKRQEH